VADGEQTQPIRELLQRFNKVKFLSSLDLTSAFLQIPLKEHCRKYTAFLFDATHYQYTRVKYSFRNSQSALIRALKMVFGPDTDGYLISYVEDLVIFSRSYDEHQCHLRTVLDKLTSAEVTINLEKCKFYQTQIKFLSHIIDQKRGISRPRPRCCRTKLPGTPQPETAREVLGYLQLSSFANRPICRKRGPSTRRPKGRQSMEVDG
jgi:hypothetical protein